MAVRANARPLQAASARDTDVVIADAAETDLASVVALDERITGVARPDFWKNFHVQKSSSDTMCVLVAKRNDKTGAGKIVGYAIGEVRAWPVRAAACGWIYAIGVEKGHRLQRTASALMSELVARFRAHGCGAVRTMIDVDNHLLMSFLRSQGMTAGPFIELEMAIEPAADPKRAS